MTQNTKVFTLVFVQNTNMERKSLCFYDLCLVFDTNTKPVFDTNVQFWLLWCQETGLQVGITRVLTRNKLISVLKIPILAENSSVLWKHKTQDGFVVLCICTILNSFCVVCVLYIFFHFCTYESLDENTKGHKSVWRCV